MIILLGLAVLVVCGIVARYLAIAREYTAVAQVVLGIAAAWIVDSDLFGAAWGLTVRNPCHRCGVHGPGGGRRGVLLAAAADVLRGAGPQANR
jgi:hypothetical protein